jgi:hypothetical protein
VSCKVLNDCSAGPLKGLSYLYRCPSSAWTLCDVVQNCGQAFRAVHSVGDEPETASRYINQREELVEDIEAHHQGTRRIAREAYTRLSSGPERNNKRLKVRNLCPRSQSDKLSITLGGVRLRSTPDEPEIDGKGRLLKVQTCDKIIFEARLAENTAETVVRFFFHVQQPDNTPGKSPRFANDRTKLPSCVAGSKTQLQLHILRGTESTGEVDQRSLCLVHNSESSPHRSVHLSHSAALSSHSAAHLSHSAVYSSYGPAFRSATHLRCIPATSAALPATVQPSPATVQRTLATVQHFPATVHHSTVPRSYGVFQLHCNASSHIAALASHSAANSSHSAAHSSYGTVFHGATHLRCIPTTVQRI